MKNVNTSVDSLSDVEWEMYHNRAEFMLDKGYVSGYTIRELMEVLYRKDQNENK